MPLNPPESLSTLGKEIANLLFYIISKNKTKAAEALKKPIPMVKKTDKDKPLFKAVKVFYRNLFDFCKEMYTLQHIGQEANGELAHQQTIQAFFLQSCDKLQSIKDSSSAEAWRDLLLEVDPLKSIIASMFHINTMQENIWKAQSKLNPFMEDIATLRPSEAKSTNINYLTTNNILTFTAAVSKPADKLIESVAEEKTTEVNHSQETNVLSQTQAYFQAVKNPSEFKKEKTSEGDKIVAFPGGLLSSTIEYLQMRLAFDGILPFLQEPFDAASLVMHTDHYVKLYIFPSWLKVNPKEKPEVEALRIILLLAERFGSIRTSLFIKQSYGIDTIFFQLANFLITQLTFDTFDILNPIKLGSFASHALSFTQIEAAFYKNEQERCLFYTRPLQLLIYLASKSDQPIAMSSSYLPTLIQILLTFYEQGTWLLLKEIDQKIFLDCLNFFIIETQKNSKDASTPILRNDAFYTVTNSYIVTLCQRGEIGKANIFLLQRTKCDQKLKSHLSTFNFYLQVVFLIRFINFLPVVDIDDSCAPHILRDHTTRFTEAIKYQMDSISVAFAEHKKAILGISPVLLEHHFPGLLECLKKPFLDKKNFCRFQLYQLSFLARHCDKSEQVLYQKLPAQFKEIVLYLAQLFDASSLSEYEELLIEPSIESIAEIKPGDETHAVVPNLAFNSEELNTIEFCTSYHEEQNASSALISVPELTDHVSYLACYRYAHRRHPSCLEVDLRQNEFLVLLQARIKRLIRANSDAFFTASAIADSLGILEETESEFKAEAPQLYKKPQAIDLFALLRKHAENKTTEKKAETKQQDDPARQLETSSELMVRWIDEIDIMLEQLQPKSPESASPSPESPLRTYTYTQGFGMNVLDRLLFFKIAHEVRWPNYQQLRNLIAFIKGGKLTETQNHYLEYLTDLLDSEILPNGLLKIQNANSPFSKAYIALISFAKNPNSPLPPVDYSGILTDQKDFIVWNKLLYAATFLKRLLSSKIPFKQDKLTSQCSKLAKEGYVLPCLQEDTSHILSFIHSWRSHLLNFRSHCLPSTKEVPQKYFLDYSETLSLFNYITILWFVQSNKDTLSEANKRFVFNSAFEYMIQRMKPPTKDKRDFLNLLVTVCIEAKKESFVLDYFTNARLNAMLDHLVQEGMLIDAKNILSAYLNVKAVKSPIARVDIKTYGNLITLLNLLIKPVQEGSEKEKQMQDLINQLSEDFLARFNYISARSLQELMIVKPKPAEKKTQAPLAEEVNLVVAANSQESLESVEQVPEEKLAMELTDKSTSGVSEIIQTPINEEEVGPDLQTVVSVDPVTSSPSPPSPHAAEKVSESENVVEMMGPELLSAENTAPVSSIPLSVSREAEILSIPAISSPFIPESKNVAPPLELIKKKPDLRVDISLPPISDIPVLALPQSTPFLLANPVPQNSVSSNQPNRFFGSEEKKQAVPYNMKLKHLGMKNYPHKFIVGKYLTWAEIPRDLLQVVGLLHVGNPQCSVIMVGASLVNLLLNPVQDNYFANIELLVVIRQPIEINFSTRLFNALFTIPFLQIYGTNDASQVIVKLGTGNQKFNIHLKFMSLAHEASIGDALYQYTESRPSNLHRLFLYFLKDRRLPPEIKGAVATLASINNKHFRLMLDGVSPAKKFLAFLELALHKMEFPLFKTEHGFYEDRWDLSYCFANLLTCGDAAIWTEFTILWEKVFTLRQIKQITSNLNECWIFYAMTGLERNLVTNKFSALDSFPLMCIPSAKMKTFAEFAYSIFLSELRSDFIADPQCLEESSFKIFLTRQSWISPETLHLIEAKILYQQNPTITDPYLALIINTIIALKERGEHNTVIRSRHIIWKTHVPEVTPASESNPSL